MFGRATIRLGIGPHSSFNYFRHVAMLQKFAGPLLGAPFCGAPVRPNMLNMSKSASVYTLVTDGTYSAQVVETRLRHTRHVRAHRQLGIEPHTHRPRTTVTGLTTHWLTWTVLLCGGKVVPSAVSFTVFADGMLCETFGSCTRLPQL